MLSHKKNPSNKDTKLQRDTMRSRHETSNIEIDKMVMDKRGVDELV